MAELLAGISDGDAHAELAGLRGPDGRPLLLGPAGDAVVLLDPAGRVRWTAAGHAELTGHPAPVAGADWTASLPAELVEPVRRMLTAGPAEDVLPCYAPELRWLRIRLGQAVRPDGSPLVLARLTDLTALPAGSTLAALIRDPLTGLYHEQSFRRLTALPAAATAGYRGALAVDIRRFRRINEVWGLAAGDRCLAETARWLTELTAPGDLVFRFGGAEFLMLLADPAAAAARLAEQDTRPVQVGRHRIRLSLQAGWADRSEPGSLVGLAEQADTAMATAKRQAWRSVIRWTGEIGERTARAAADEEAVQQALAADEVTVLFQPVVDLAAGRVASVEALVRLGGPAAELPTEEILATSHRLGLTPQFAERIYQLAFTGGRRLRQVFPDCLFQVNVSREFLSTGLAVDTVLAAARRCGVPPAEVVLELTEEVAADLPAELLFAELGRATEHGLQLAIDDFGRGETSLALLRKLPLTAIKLDRSLLPTQPDERGWQFVAGVVSLLARLTGRIVAEGVETPEQSRRLRELGIDCQQGYLFAEPRDVDYWLANGLRL